MIIRRLAVAGSLVVVPGIAFAQERLPIIDMHMHARMHVLRAHDGTVVPRPCDPQPCTSPPTVSTSDDALLKQTIAAMDRHNIVLGFVGDTAERLDRWMTNVPQAKRFLPATFPRNAIDEVPQKIAELRRRAAAGEIRGIGEVGTQYEGLPPNDPRLAPYFALAEELDLPVLIHTAGLGAHLPRFLASNGHPLLLEEVVIAHPKLRIYVENAGYPFLEEMIALMTRHPQVHADVSTITWVIPRSAFYRYLTGLIEAGLGKRIMFGSDQMEWPETIDLAVDAIESASFLTSEQKRDIFYNNAARFLRLPQQ
jgi:predicted TIM-barrel fold metal-dependent hydrolase